MDSEGLFLRFDEWSGKIQAKLDDHRKSVNAINTLMGVAAFIAGVQAQIISFTLELPQSALGRTTNFFAFLGLILEISGTFLGAIHALVLQHKVKDVSNTISHMVQCRADLKIIIQAPQQRKPFQSEENLEQQVPAPAQQSNFDNLNQGEPMHEPRSEEQQVSAPAEESDTTLEEELISGDLDRGEIVQGPTTFERSSGQRANLEQASQTQPSLKKEPEPVEELFSADVLDDLDQRRPAQEPSDGDKIFEDGLHTLFDSIYGPFGIAPLDRNASTGEPVKKSRPRFRPGFRPDPEALQPLDHEEEEQVLNPPNSSANTVISKRATGVSFDPVVNNHIYINSFNSSQMTNVSNSIANTVDHKSDVDDLEERAMNVIIFLHEMDPHYKDLAPPRLIHKIVELTKKVVTATERDLEIARQNNSFSFGRNISILRFVVTYGNIPLMSMAGGVACMALSTILFAASSQFLKPEVWIASLVALLGVMGLSFLPICSFILKLFPIRFGKPLPFKFSSHLPDPVTSKRR